MGDPYFIMKLFRFENFELQISEEAFLIDAFKKLWNRDRSQSKKRALAELGYIYFMYDPRSDYMFITDDTQRSKIILEQEGLSPDYNIDKVMQEAIKVYKFLTQTSASLLLEDTRISVDKLRDYVKNIDLNAVDDKGKPIYTLNMFTNTIKQIPELAQKLIEAEEAVAKETEEKSKMRGQGVKKIFEDGFNIG